MCFVAPPAPASWLYLATSATIHFGYYAALAGAYKAGDLSHGYPIMRGVAPLLVALASAFWFGEHLGPAAWTGVLLICGGVLSLGLAGGGASRKATAWALFSALVISVYTLADGAGARVSGGADRYVAWLFVFLGLPFGVVVTIVKRGAFLRHARRYWWRGLAGATPRAFPTASRCGHDQGAGGDHRRAARDSVRFAALIGAWLLKEGHLKERLVGAAAVLAGLIALKL